jgi:hypothetical protein
MDETDPLVWRLKVALWTNQQLFPGGRHGQMSEGEFALLAFVLAQSLRAAGYERPRQSREPVAARG